MKIRLHLLLALLLAACSGSRDLAEAPQKHPAEAGDKAKESEQRARVMALFMEATKARLAGEMGSATQLFEQVLKADPKNDAACFELSKLYFNQQRGEEALAMARKARELDPGNIWYHFLLADLDLQLGRTDEAVKVYRDILDRWPDRVEVYFDLANALAYSGRTDEGRKVYRDLEERFGRSEELVMEEFNMLANTGDYEAARQLLERELADQPDRIDYRGMLAELYDEMGLHELAFAEYQRILDQDPDDSMARIALAEHHYSQGDLGKAYEQLDHAFGDPDLDLDAKMQVLLGFYEMTRSAGSGTGEQEEMLQRTYDLIGTLERAHPESGKPHTIHGDFLMRDNRFTEAREQFQLALEYEKDRFPIWQQLLQLDLQLQDNEAVVEDAAQAIELFPTQPTLYLFHGIGLSQLGRHDEAVETLTMGRDLVIDDPMLQAQFWTSLGDAHNEAGEFAASDRAFDQALKLRPDDPTTLNNYAYYLSLRNDRLEKAAQMSLRSNELAPGQPSFQDTYAWVLYQQGKYSEARTWIEKALASGGSGEGVIVEHYGDILFKLGDEAGAREQWQRARDLGGASDAIDRKAEEGRP